MSKSKELKNTSAIVKEVLENNPAARNSDDTLIFAVCSKINPLCTGLSFGTVIANRKALGLPAFETIRRARQKLCTEHPELCGNSTVEAHRKLNEDVFRDYARQ